jgi:hypothetical protein
MEPVLARSPDGTLSLLFLPREFAELLLELPSILDADDRPEVRSRRYQDPTDDAETNAEWQRMMREELVHLFGEARDVVAQDLELLEKTLDHPIGARLDIPPDHVNAWISALQIARVSLGATHGLDEEPVDVATVLAEPGERAGAMLRIHVLGDLQALLLQEIAPDVTESGPESEEEGDDDGESEDPA